MMEPGRAAAAASARKARRGRFFFVAAALLLLAVVFAGFAPTFYLKGVYGLRTDHYPPYLYAHGIVMSAWYLLYLAQAGLVAAGRSDIHRRLGIAGALLAVAVVALGYYTTTRFPTRALAAGLDLHVLVEQIHGNRIVIGNLLGLPFFAAFVAAGILLRGRPAAHRRLMFMAFLMTIGPALTTNRMFGAWLHGLLPAWIASPHTLLVYAALLGLAAYDLYTRGRVHAVTVLAALWFLLLQPWITGLVIERFARGDLDCVPPFAGWFAHLTPCGP
jgi:hypothetical protein